MEAKGTEAYSLKQDPIEPYQRIAVGAADESGQPCDALALADVSARGAHIRVNAAPCTTSNLDVAGSNPQATQSSPERPCQYYGDETGTPTAEGDRGKAAQMTTPKKEP